MTYVIKTGHNLGQVMYIELSRRPFYPTSTIPPWSFPEELSIDPSIFHRTWSGLRCTKSVDAETPSNEGEGRIMVYKISVRDIAETTHSQACRTTAAPRKSGPRENDMYTSLWTSSG